MMPLFAASKTPVKSGALVSSGLATIQYCVPKLTAVDRNGDADESAAGAERRDGRRLSAGQQRSYGATRVTVKAHVHELGSGDPTYGDQQLSHVRIRPWREWHTDGLLRKAHGIGRPEDVVAGCIVVCVRGGGPDVGEDDRQGGRGF